jgi:hypothetical protein
MPFTPFHLGAALIVKPAAKRHFSVITFGLAQIAMDIEPGIGMMFDRDVLHGPSHTLIGALLIALVIVWIAPHICNPILARYNREVIFYKVPWLCEPESVSRTSVLSGVLFGTLSHIVLDSLMHADIHPLAPLTPVNPLLGLVSHDGVYAWCVVFGVTGAAAWLHGKLQLRRQLEELAGTDIPDIRGE